MPTPSGGNHDVHIRFIPDPRWSLLPLRPVVACVLLAVLLAGCSKPEAPASTTGPAAATPDPALQGASAGASVVANATPDAPAPRVVPLSFEGSLPTFVEACAFAGSGDCVSLTPLGEFHNRFELDERGNLSSLALTLTWEPTSAASAEMWVVFYSVAGEGEDFEFLGSAKGTSPLAFSRDALVMDPARTFRLGVGVPSNSLGNGDAWASLALAREQPFTLAGQMAFSG